MKKAKEMNVRARSRRCLTFEALESRDLLEVSGSLLESLQDASQQNATNAFDSTFQVAPASFGEEIESAAIPISAAEGENTGESWYSLADSTLNPSADEQELLEQINRFRADPQGELARIFSAYGDDALVARNSLVNDAIKLNSYPKNSIPTFLTEWSSLTSASPLAFSTALNNAASSHSSYMRQKNDVSHTCFGEDDLATRLAKAGFSSGISSEDGQDEFGENIGGSFLENGGFSVASYMLAAFAVDWGVPTHDHRDTMINAAYTEVGISVLQTAKLIGPYIVTCDFGSSVDGERTDGAYLLGVVYDDADEDLFYDVGEGVQNATIVIERLDGSDASVTISSWNSGGYQIFLANGDYRVTVVSENLANPIAKTVSISDGTNQKLDFRTSDVGETAPVVDLNGNAEGVDLTVEYKEGSDEPIEPLKDSALVVSDADSDFLYGAKIYFGSRPDGESEIIDVSVAGTNLRANFKDQSGSIELTGEGSVAEYQSVIASLSYYNSLELCDLSSERYLLISVYDGAYWSAEAKLEINVLPATLPTLTVNDLEVYEGDAESQVVYFDVTLDQPARVDVSLEFQISGAGSAIEGLHYVLPQGDPIVISAGETSARIECYVVGNYNPMKPEGLSEEAEGGFEKPFVDFYIEAINVKNAELANENGLARGVIYDDDSPIVLGVANEYAYDKALDVEAGLRRYVYTLKPGASGLFTWSADALDLPEDVAITVRKGALDAEAVATSKGVDAGARVQWQADPSAEYWITVESKADVSKLAARLLEFVDDQTVLIDPLIEDMEEPQLVGAWGDGGFEFGVGDWTWDWSASDLNGLSFRTSRPNVEFIAEIPAGTSASVSPAGDDSGTNLDLGDDQVINFSGVSTLVYNGNDSHEELVLTGTQGDDYLYYSNGTGYFQTSDGQTISFNGVNKVSINGGGGNDYADIQDSIYNDRLTTSNSSIVASGGGYELTATYFAKSRIVFNQGGTDEYYATDSGEDVVMSLANGSTLCRGTYLFESENAEEDPEAPTQTENVEYSRVVIGVESTIISPTEYVGSVELNDGLSSSSEMVASIGVLTRNDKNGKQSVSIERAKNLTINGVHQFADSRFTINTNSGYESYVEDGYVTIVDPVAGWKLRAPSWKSLTPVEETPAPETDDSSALLSSVLLDEISFVPFALVGTDEEQGVFFGSPLDDFQVEPARSEDWRRPIDMAFEDFSEDDVSLETSFLQSVDEYETFDDGVGAELTLDPFVMRLTSTAKKKRFAL